MGENDPAAVPDFFESLIAASPLMVSVLDLATGSRVYVNPEYTRLTGLDLATFTAMTERERWELIHPDDLERVGAAWAEFLSTAGADRSELRFRYKTISGWRWILNTSSVFSQNDDGTIRHVMFTGLDVHEEMEAQALSNTIVEGTPNIVVIYDDASGEVEYANPAFRAATGYRAEDLKGLDRALVPSLVHPDDLAAEREAIDTTIDTAQPVRLRHRLQTAAGQSRWMDTTYVRFPDTAGNLPRRILILSADVTEQVEADVFREAILDINPAVTVVLDGETRGHLYANPAYLATTGHTLEELEELGLEGRLALTPQEDRDLVAEATAEALRTGETTRVVQRYRGADGTARWYDTRFRRFPDPAGAAADRILASGIDVTEGVESAAFNETILASSPALIVVVDTADAQTLYTNPAFEAATGHTAASLNAMLPEEMFALTPDDQRAVVDAAIQRTIATGEITAAERSYRSADGTVRWYDSRFLRLPNTGSHVLITATDTTERRTAEHALDEERRRLEQANADLQSFVHIASHDLQEPLRTISAFSDLLALELGDDLPEGAVDPLRFVGEGAARMQGLVAGLLEYSRVGATRSPRVTDTARLANAVVADLTDLISREAATIHLGDLPTLHADETELRLTLQNLIANAIKFHAPERPPVVSVDASSYDGGWRFAISDNGIGLDEAHHERVFGIFQRLHLRTEYEGTGVGLALCKRAVENHGGQIGVDAELGSGSTFWFTIPEVGRV